MHFLELALAAALVAWCALGVFHLWNKQGMTILRPGQPGERPRPVSPAPRVSIILAARNEEASLPATLASLLSLDYPDYEVTLVDDDSTDRTGAIADDWVARSESHGRLRVIHNHALPPGWRGKVHALDLATRQASGEWLLSTDADVVFNPAALQVAIAAALRQGAQLVSMAPEFEFGSLAEKAVMPAFSFLLATLFPLRLVNSPRSCRAIAAGAFILMRRSDFEQLGGYASLRDTVVEDLRTAQLFKQSGRRIYVAISRGLFRTRMYANFGELWEGLRRSAFEGTGMSIAKALAGLVGGNLLGTLSWVSALCLLTLDLAAGRGITSDRALLLALAACAATALVYVPFLIFLRVSPLYVITLPLATLLYSSITIDSMARSLVGGGVSWKGRQYGATNR